MAVQGRERSPVSLEEDAWRDLVHQPQTLLVGLGGAGSEALEDLQRLGLPDGVETLAINTDGRHLQSIEVHERILVGRNALRGRGSGGDRHAVSQVIPEIREELLAHMRPYQVVFFLAGLGGGTGSALLPACRALCRELGALPVPVAFLPFRVELDTNPVRRQNSLEAMSELETDEGLILVLDNEKLRRFETLPLKHVLRLRNTYLHKLTVSLVDMVTNPSEINVDLALLRRHLEHAGISTLLAAEGHVSDPEKLVQQALTEGFLDFSVETPGPALVHIEGGSNMTLRTLHRVLDSVRAGLHEPTELTLGTRIREEASDSVRLTAIVGGLGARTVQRALRA